MIEKNISEIIRDNMFNYSAYVDLDRAIPSIESGLKPSLERILWTMYEGKNFKFTKSMDIEGNTSKIHPHGGTYPTIVNMVQTDKQNIPLLTGQGNFGNHTSKELQYAASRYTKVKLSDIAIDTMKEIDKHQVDFVDSYDGKKKIPEYIPSKFPLILCYASKGIGVGMGSNIPSFNLVELCNAVSQYITTGEKTLMIPDFATKGYIIHSEKDFRTINDIGRGSIKLRSNCRFDRISNTIDITEIPHSTTREEIIDKVIELIKEGKLKEINDIKDASGFNGQKIKITCKKNTNMDLLMKKLYKLTPLESSFAVNLNVLTKGTPKVLGVWNIIDLWLEFREECIRKRLTHELKEAKKELHILAGLENVLVDIDAFIETVRFTKESELKCTIKEKFNIDDTQFDYVIKMNIRNINKDYITKKISDKNLLESDIEKLNISLNDNSSIRNIICEELEYVAKKFGVKRNSEIITVNEDFKIEDAVIEDYNVQIALTNEGYIKKIRLTSLRGAGSHKLKDNDFIVSEDNTTNKSDLLVFTTKQNCYKIKTYSLEDTKVSNLGLYLPSYLQLESDERIIKVISTINYKEDILVAFENGKVARIPLSSYETKTNRTKLVKALNETNVVNMYRVDDEKKYILVSSKGKGYIFSSKDINRKASKSTQGVTVMKHKDIEVTKFKPVDECKITSINYYRNGKAGSKLSIFDQV